MEIGDTLSITVTQILMPPSLCSLSGITVYTGDTSYNRIEIASFPTITNSLPGTDLTAISPSVATITT